MRYLTVTVRDRNKTIRAMPEPSANLRELLLDNGASPYKGIQKLLNCRGKGMCGTCLVRVVDNPAGLTDRTPIEIQRLGPTSPQARLACQAWVCGDITIDLRRTVLNSSAQLLEEAEQARSTHAAALTGE